MCATDPFSSLHVPLFGDPASSGGPTLRPYRIPASTVSILDSAQLGQYMLEAVPDAEQDRKAERHTEKS